MKRPGDLSVRCTLLLRHWTTKVVPSLPDTAPPASRLLYPSPWLGWVMACKLYALRDPFSPPPCLLQKLVSKEPRPPPAP